MVPWNASLQRTSCYASRQQARKVVLSPKNALFIKALAFLHYER